MPSFSVVKQNFPKTNVIVNDHILIIHNWSGYGFINFLSNWHIFKKIFGILYEMNCHPQYFIWEKYAYLCGILMKLNCMPKIYDQKFHLHVVIRERDKCSLDWQVCTLPFVLCFLITCFTDRSHIPRNTWTVVSID